VNELISVKHKLDENERMETLNRMFENDKVQLFVPNYAKKAKDVERLHKVLENVKYALLKCLQVVKTWFVTMQFFLLLFLANMVFPKLFFPKQ
jgi:regulator of sirC expression with transglutaminase-like and TPR domain